MLYMLITYLKGKINMEQNIQNIGNGL